MARHIVGRDSLRRIVDVDRVRPRIGCRSGAGWASRERLGNCPRDVCKPRDSRLLKRLEKGLRLGRTMNDGKKGGAYVHG